MELPTTTPPSAVGRKRARPAAQLRDQVRTLMRQTRAPLVAQRRSLALAYDAAWHAFCRAVANEGDGHDAAAEALRGLARGAQCVDSANELLAAKIAGSVAAARGHARHQRLLLVWTWLGHTSAGRVGRLWRLENVLVAVETASSRGLRARGETDAAMSAGGWVRGAMRSMVATNDDQSGALEARWLYRLAGRDPGESMSTSIIKYLVQTAFSFPDNDARDATQSTNVHGLALAVLDSVCNGGPGEVIPTPLALVCSVVAENIKLRRHESDSGAVVAAQRAFLRAQVKASLTAIVSCSAQPLPGGDERAMHEILATFQASASAADVVQLFRQTWVDAKTASPSDRDPIEMLAPLISSCAQRDGSFRCQALAMAHDLAYDAIMASDAVLLRHSLELAGAATVAPPGEDGQCEDAGYTEWFRNHFAAVDTQSISSVNSTASSNARHSLSGNEIPSLSPQVCPRAPAPSPSSVSSTSGQPMCLLVSTKRHLQFVCAFLSEFDRAESPRRTAYHVMAHLSAIKTHQTVSGSAVGGLLSDFFSQARARYSELNSREQEATARHRRRDLSSLSSVKTMGSIPATPSQATPASSQYPPRTRGLVEELLDLHRRDQTALVSRVNQLKMFEAPRWRHEILPCCLDFEYWQSEGIDPQHMPDEGENFDMIVQHRKRVSSIVSFVQVLAKHHAVGASEYAAFLGRVESWFTLLKPQADTNHQRHTSHSDREQQLIKLDDFANEYFANQSEETPSTSSWGSVTSAFVLAFEGLVFERPVEQLEQMERIHGGVVDRLVEATAVRSLSIGRAVDHYLTLWVALFSNETGIDATPQERMDVMEAYCKFASQHATRELPQDRSVLSLDDRLVEIAVQGSLLGLLATMKICEALARAVSLAFCVQLEPTIAEPTVDDLVSHLKRASAFLGGFLLGFTKTSTETAPQMLLQSMLSPQMRECLIWVGQHTATWWNNDLTPGLHDAFDATAPEDPLWSFVQQTIQSVYDQHGWFRLTFSPGVFTTKDQWQVFVAMELTCCVTQLLSGASRRIDVVEFICLQHEQMHGLMISSSGGQSAGVRIVDICMWIVQATLELSASPSHVEPFALDALVLLLKDVWDFGVHGDPSSDGSQPSDVLGFLMELTLQFVERAQNRHAQLIRYAVRCASVVVEGRNPSPSPTLVDIPGHVVRNFVDRVCLAAGETVVPFEWISVVWCIVVKLQHSVEVYTTAVDIPTRIFAHCAFEFPRLCRLLTVRKTGKVSHATNSSLLRTVQTCYEFFRTLNVRRLAPAPSMALFGVSASQYVPSSAADEIFELHVRALEWLIASGRLVVPTVGADIENVAMLGFDTSLAFHEVASRVLGALLEDVSIGRPEDVANELTEICQSVWLTSVSTTAPVATVHRFQFQLLLVHMVADLAARHASVGRFLLRSSSELLNDSRQSLFLLFVLIVSKELEQIESILKLNGSLWVNSFAEVACALQDLQEPQSEGAVLPSILSIMRHAPVFEAQLVGVLSRILSFAVAKQIDLLDAAVVERVERLFPSLRELLARVPVLNLASAALSDW